MEIRVPARSARGSQALKPLPPKLSWINYPKCDTEFCHKPREIILTEETVEVTVPGEPEPRTMMKLLLEGKAFRDPISIFPKNGTTEQWALINLTPDAHPIHLHLAHFRVVAKFNTETKEPLEGGPDGVLPHERGFKDTVVVPFESTVIIEPFFPRPGLYVFHCHILEHEENEMMRPFKVIEHHHSEL